MVDKVHQLAEREGAPGFFNGHPLFEFSPGVPVVDEQAQEDEEDINEDDDGKEDKEDEEY